MLKITVLIFGLINNSLLFAGCNEAKKFCLNECKKEASQVSDCEDSCNSGFDKCEYADGSSTEKCPEFQRQCSSKCFKVKDPEKCERACQAGKHKCE
jgi:hypothetical protein